jgi:uncharacterized protein
VRVNVLDAGSRSPRWSPRIAAEGPLSVFADSSALVKLYADEAGHESVRRLRGPLVISALARVEVAAAIWRKQRRGELDLDDSLILLRAFAVDYAGTSDRPPQFIAVAVTEEILGRAAELTGTHGLRAYDAVQLASALAARAVDRRCAALAAFDRELLQAAISEGFKNATAPASRERPPSPPRDPSGSGPR